MVKTVVREHHWNLEKIDELYLDKLDNSGLIFWYDDVLEVIAEIDAERKKAKGKKGKQ